MTEKKRPPGGHNKPGASVTPTAMPSLGIDWDYYMEMLEESDAPDAQKRELIETLWGIVVAFVDIGFGVHPIQQACEQNKVFEQISALDLPEMLDLKHSSKPEFDASSNSTKEPIEAGRVE
ncbi:hypothetical protein [Roseibium aggregatum]|uniref:hypothetical protein n=1 Tax=Roseibium aggregatum TaxID=187304 RepID=UPI001E382DC9|nr:hypothetical protein [Roseibium aggregatum]UES36690.1 hypothetical protein GFC08_01805 [Roseibium aggregatum]